jgi:hypothetical protein
MKSILQARNLFVLTLVVMLTGNIVAASMGTAFSFQGRLQQSGSPANGLYDFQFSLWDAASNGTLVGATQAVVGVTTSNGLFGAQLDFGSGPLGGSARWLEVGVRTNGGAFISLSSRQQLLPMPYAIMASNLLGTLPAAQLSGTLPSSALEGYSGAVTFTNPANSYVGTFAGNGGGLTNISFTKQLHLIFEGDSLTQEAGTGTDSSHTAPYSTYPLYLRMLLTYSIGSWHNYAVGGDNLADVTNRLATVLNGVDRAPSNTVMFLWVGANDFAPINWYGFQPITNTDSWVGTWEYYCSNVQSAGIKLIAFTIQNRYGWSANSNYNYFRTNVNSRIRTSAFYDWLVDMDYRNPDMNPSNNWRTYDGTHANTNGAIWQAGLVDKCLPVSLGGP